MGEKVALPARKVQTWETLWARRAGFWGRRGEWGGGVLWESGEPGGALVEANPLEIGACQIYVSTYPCAGSGCRVSGPGGWLASGPARLWALV